MKPALLALFSATLAAVPARAEMQTFDCVAEPAQRVQVGSPVTGLLAQVKVGRGDEVKRGDELARLESTVEEANVALATAQANARASLESQRTRLELAQANLDRSLKLVNSGAVTQSKLEELEAIVAIARRDLDTEELRLRFAAIELERQQALLARQSIRSPLDGVVVEQNLRAGEFVRQDSAVLTIAQTDPLHVEAYVPTALWGKVAKGSRGTVSLEQPAETRIDAEVTVVDRIFDAASGTFGIRLALPNPGGAIPAGQRCKVSFRTHGRGSMIHLPARAATTRHWEHHWTRPSATTGLRVSTTAPPSAVSARATPSASRSERISDGDACRGRADRCVFPWSPHD